MTGSSFPVITTSLLGVECDWASSPVLVQCGNPSPPRPAPGPPLGPVRGVGMDRRLPGQPRSKAMSLAAGAGRRAYHPRVVRSPAIASTRYLAGRTVRRTSVASYEGYCVKCREKRQFEGQEVELANGRRAAQGTCPTCGTKMNRILGKKTT